MYDFQIAVSMYGLFVTKAHLKQVQGEVLMFQVHNQ